MLILFLPLLSFSESLFLFWPQHGNTGNSYTSLEACSYRTKIKALCWQGILSSTGPCR